MRVCIGYTGATPVRQTFAAVDAAEAAGLDGVWSAEHVGLNDAIVPSVAYALRTSRVEIGLVGLNADTRHPGVLAMELATLTSLAPGRIRIQVGTPGRPSCGHRRAGAAPSWPSGSAPPPATWRSCPPGSSRSAIPASARPSSISWSA